MKIIATLIDSKNFHKSIEIPELKPIIYMPALLDLHHTIASTEITIPDSLPYKELKFILQRWKTVKQPKGLEHIVAVYKEY